MMNKNKECSFLEVKKLRVYDEVHDAKKRKEIIKEMLKEYELFLTRKV